MKKILITGASGMLGATLVDVWKDKYIIFATGGSDFPVNSARNYKVFDLLSDSYDDLAKFCQPEFIIHCAAITKVEQCEKNPEAAMKINGESVKKLLNAFPQSKLIFISTDKVFSSKTHRGTERNLVDPATVYGKSKALGEKYILQSPSRSMIIRTVIVGKNINKNKKSSLAEWIVYSLLKKQRITLFSDVIFTPISIWHFAYELAWIIEHYDSFMENKIFHISGSDIISKYEFGYRLSKNLKLNTDLILEGSIVKSKLMINNLKDLTLDSTKYQSFSGRKLPTSSETISMLVKNFSN